MDYMRRMELEQCGEHIVAMCALIGIEAKIEYRPNRFRPEHGFLRLHGFYDIESNSCESENNIVRALNILAETADEYDVSVHFRAYGEKISEVVAEQSKTNIAKWGFRELRYALPDPILKNSTPGCFVRRPNQHLREAEREQEREQTVSRLEANRLEAIRRARL